MQYSDDFTISNAEIDRGDNVVRRLKLLDLEKTTGYNIVREVEEIMGISEGREYKTSLVFPTTFHKADNKMYGHKLSIQSGDFLLGTSNSHTLLFTVSEPNPVVKEIPLKDFIDFIRSYEST